MDSEDYIDGLLADLRAIPDPEARVRAIDEEKIRYVGFVRRVFAELRKEAILEMLNTMSKSEVARRLGLSKVRVGQLTGTGMRYPGRHTRVVTTEETTA